MNNKITKMLVLIGGCWTLKTVVKTSYCIGYIKGIRKCEDIVKNLPKETISRMFVTEREAKKVLHVLKETIEIYEQATISDLNDLTNMDSTFKDNHLGWTDLESGRVVKRKSGAELILPSPENLDTYNERRNPC